MYKESKVYKCICNYCPHKEAVSACALINSLFKHPENEAEKVYIHTWGQIILKMEQHK